MAAAGPVPAAPAGSRFASSKVARQIAVLGLVLSVIALSLAYPLRNYLGQRADLAAAVSRQHDLEQRIVELKIQQSALADPDYITAEAKRRLQYVRPGDTVYVVQAPELPPAESAGDTSAESGGPWYSTLWDTLSNDSGPAVDPTVLIPAPGGAPVTIGPDPAGEDTDAVDHRMTSATHRPGFGINLEPPTAADVQAGGVGPAAPGLPCRRAPVWSRSARGGADRAGATRRHPVPRRCTTCPAPCSTPPWAGWRRKA